MTITMVTHEHDIALFTKRNVVMRDGVIVSDIRVPQRSVARDELRRLDAATKTAQLAP